jgi:hypothetical protein
MQKLRNGLYICYLESRDLYEATRILERIFRIKNKAYWRAKRLNTKSSLARFVKLQKFYEVHDYEHSKLCE